MLSFPSVCSYHSKNSKQQTSVATWLQLKILLSRQQTVYPQDMRAGQTQRCGLDLLCFPFYTSVSSPWSLIGSVLWDVPPSIRKGPYFSHQRFPLWSLDFLLWSLFAGFLTTILHSSFSYSGYLTEIKYIFKNYRSSKKKKEKIIQSSLVSYLNDAKAIPSFIHILY